MNNSKEERLKIAVFIDFDNIAIGVKQSLGRNFDVGTVLEAIKEKGQVVTKIAYGDWKRNEDFSRAMTQHAVQMVQRNLTPGGDKNGADIALALDALEMAFTRDHINAFVIVGGDSDFIALVEKLKQYDKIVFVVGGRAFTSVILQKNCHEFISYENLIGVQSGGKRFSGRQQMIPSPASLETALPLIRRSLKILSDREVSPQLGLLKSTLLQLDSTFSERDFGVSSFRDFTQKLADAGYVNLKKVDRSLLVELKDIPESDQKAATESNAGTGAQAAQVNGSSKETFLTSGQPSEAIRSLQQLIRNSKASPHWPLYLRSFKQFLRSLQPPYDEHQFGITSTYDLVRQAQKDGLLHVERNRQGILRIYPGELFPQESEFSDTEESKPDAVPGSDADKSEREISVESETDTPEPEALKPGKKTDQSKRGKRDSETKRKSRKQTKTAKSVPSRKRTVKSKETATKEAVEPKPEETEVVAKAEDKGKSTGDRREKEEPSASEEIPAEAIAKEVAGKETETVASKPAVKRKRKTTTTRTVKKKSTTVTKAKARKTPSRKATTKRKAKEEKTSENA